MNFEEHVYSVLLVSSSETVSSSIASLMPQSRFYPVIRATDACSAGRQLIEKRYDIVIINTPLTDDFGTRLALDTASNSTTGVLLLVKAEHYPEISFQVSPFGVLTLSKPTSAQMITQSLLLLCGTRERFRRMEEKTASLEEKMTEIRTVNRAKLILIEQLRMTETEAHRYIEKQAMDRCITRRAVAKKIISTYK